MTFTTRDNSGALFKNTDKRAGHEDADYRGKLTVAGVEYWVNGWIREAKADGAKYMSLSVRPKEAVRPQEDLRAKTGQQSRPRYGDDF